MIELARSIDNPIALRAVFGRIRFPGAWLQIGLISVLSLVIVGGAFAMATFSLSRLSIPDVMTGAFGILFGLQALLLLLAGTSSVASAVAADRERAVFDMMRMVPRPASQIVGGYILGMPVREHLWVLVIMPFAWLAMFFSKVSVFAGLALYLNFYTAALLYHAQGALLGMVLKKTRNAASSAVGILFLYLILGWRFVPVTFYRTVGWAFNPNRQDGLTQFFMTKLPVWLVDGLFMSVFAAALWVAAQRKFRTEDRPALSKLQALGFACFCLVFAIGDNYPDLTGRGTGGWMSGMGAPREAAYAMYAYIAFILSAFLILVATPTAALYRRAVRSKLKQGRSAILPHEDAGMNESFTGAMIILFLLTLLPVIQGSTLAPAKFAALAFAFASGLVLLSGILQWCTLRFERSWPAVSIGMLVMFWGFPIGLAILAGIAGLPWPIRAGLGSLFPFIGMAYAVTDDAMAGGAVANVIGLVIGGVFHALALRARNAYWTAKPI